MNSRVKDCSILVLACLVAFSAILPIHSAHAGGLRETALQLIDDIDLGVLEACPGADAVEALVAEIELAEAEIYMAAEMTRLLELRTQTRAACESIANVLDPDTLLELCERLATEGQHCRFLALCESVNLASSQMKGFWGAALTECARPE